VTIVSKKMASGRLLAEHAELFRCPICKAEMEVIEYQSLICSNKHCFDLAKQGYINLLAQGHKTKYDKGLFEARRAISDIGFFDPMLDRIIAYMEKGMRDSNARTAIMDAGCGEGSHLNRLMHTLSLKGVHDAVGVGLDIAKEGIHAASRGDERTIWCVADLANCPIADKQLNTILNILSPSNYAEFTRLLADDGQVIKVMPESGYLQELREVFYRESDKDTYSNEKTLQHFSRSFKLVHSERIEYKVHLDRAALEQLIYMTPLSWSASEAEKERALDQNISDITCDFLIVVGK